MRELALPASALHSQTNTPVKLGRISPAGTKVRANASRHEALSYGHIGRIETLLHEEAQQLIGMLLKPSYYYIQYIFGFHFVTSPPVR